MTDDTIPISLIRTKMHQPPIHENHLHRPPLLERLDRRRQRSLALVSAPAGYGKSTLLSVFKVRFSAFVQQGLAMLSIVRIIKGDVKGDVGAESSLRMNVEIRIRFFPQ